MDLREVTNLDQLKTYYEQEGLDTVDKKIQRLAKIMNVQAVRCERGPAPENMLAILEGGAIVGSWRDRL